MDHAPELDLPEILGEVCQDVWSEAAAGWLSTATLQSSKTYRCASFQAPSLYHWSGRWVERRSWRSTATPPNTPSHVEPPEAVRRSGKKRPSEGKPEGSPSASPSWIQRHMRIPSLTSEISEASAVETRRSSTVMQEEEIAEIPGYLVEMQEEEIPGYLVEIHLPNLVEFKKCLFWEDLLDFWILFVAQIWLEASLLFVNFYFRLSSRFSRSISFYTLAVGFSFHHLLSTKRI